jgi:hypothetical protein
MHAVAEYELMLSRGSRGNAEPVHASWLREGEAAQVAALSLLGSGGSAVQVVLPAPRVTILHVPFLLPPMLIRNDSAVMRDLLLPRRNRDDSARLFGRLCFMWNCTAEAVLRSHNTLNKHFADAHALDSFLSGASSARPPQLRGDAHPPSAMKNKSISDEEQRQGFPSSESTTDSGAWKTEPMTCSTNESGLLHPPRVHPRIASKPIDVEDVLLREAPNIVKLQQGGYFSDCIHPSLAGYQEIVKSVVEQLAAELHLFL